MVEQKPKTTVSMKQEYVVPKLTEFGALARLSQAGTGGVPEGNSTSLTKKPCL